jgi:dTDP-4-dehydrorhamnose 3,5-epimerase
VSNFEFSPLEIPGVILVTPRFFRDSRGYFAETFRYDDFSAAGIPGTFLQDNQSRSIRGVLRGLHYQKEPFGQGKLVRCLKGTIFDVAVDIRLGSPYYGKWVAAELNEDNGFMLYVPPGFAHGFIALSDIADVLYKCTRVYSPENDRGIIWNDASIAIKWPVNTPLLSAKDAALPLLLATDNNFTWKGNG